jgi:hypothetical protein
MIAYVLIALSVYCVTDDSLYRASGCTWKHRALRDAKVDNLKVIEPDAQTSQWRSARNHDFAPSICIHEVCVSARRRYFVRRPPPRDGRLRHWWMLPCVPSQGGPGWQLRLPVLEHDEGASSADRAFLLPRLHQVNRSGPPLREAGPSRLRPLPHQQQVSLRVRGITEKMTV